jgi:hypothetical protein
MLDRFGPDAGERLPVVPMEPVAREVLATYRAYWRAALVRPDAREAEVANLAVALRRLLQCDGAADMDAIEPFAKLVEVAQARETRARMLTKFTEDQGDDPASPHAYANKRVLATLTRSLGLPSDVDLVAVDIARLQAAAVRALRDDTRRLLAARGVSAGEWPEDRGDQ